MEKKEFYESEESRVMDAIEELDPNDENYPKLLARLDQIDNHKNLMVERRVMNERRQERGFKKWASGLNPNTVMEVVGSGVAYVAGILAVTHLEKAGGAFISGAKSLFSKIRLR